MQSENEKQQEIPANIKYQSPAIINIQAVNVFVAADTEFDAPLTVLARCLCNMTSYMVQQSIFHYHPRKSEDEIVDDYLYKLSLFLNDSCWKYYLLNRQKKFPKDETAAKAFINEFDHFPECPEQLHDQLITIAGYIHKIQTLSKQIGNDFWYKLYNLSASWAEQQKKASMHLADSEILINHAEAQSSLYFSKTESHYLNCIKWGMEYDEYYHIHIRNGLSERKAHGLSRQDFIANHPIPYANISPSDKKSYPGHSRSILKKYQTIYLNWKNNHDKNQRNSNAD